MTLIPKTDSFSKLNTSRASVYSLCLLAFCLIILLLYTCTRSDIGHSIDRQMPQDLTYREVTEVVPLSRSKINLGHVGDLNGPDIHMDDPKLVKLLREKFLISPPMHNVSLNLSNPWLYDTSMGQSTMIKEILNYKRNGFYVECGALDGETRSNSLVFERLYNWTGLLIEADPLNFSKAVEKRRRAYLSQSCLSIKPYPVIVSFEQAYNIGKISLHPAGFNKVGYTDVQCFPFYTYLLALNRSTIDYFSLDVEGSELEVLETIPFDKINIKALSVEFIHGARGKEEIKAFMERKGYIVYGEVTHFDNLANDFIFVKQTENSLRR